MHSGFPIPDSGFRIPDSRYSFRLLCQWNLDFGFVQPRNDPQIDPQMISISLHVDPEMIPNKFLEWNGIQLRNYYKSVAAFTFLNRI